jgi:hypothetical protein
VRRPVWLAKYASNSDTALKKSTSRTVIVGIENSRFSALFVMSRSVTDERKLAVGGLQLIAVGVM